MKTYLEKLHTILWLVVTDQKRNS